MIGFRTEKLKEEWLRAAVALRLVVEALDEAHGGATFVFRVTAPTRFEHGVHSVGLAMDVELRGLSSEELNKICTFVNARFPVKGVARPVCSLQEDPANLPSGKRINTPHVHVQIPFDWKLEPRAFLEAYGYIKV